MEQLKNEFKSIVNAKISRDGIEDLMQNTHLAH